MRKDNIVENFHGTMVKDPYRWLEDGSLSETKDWILKQTDSTKNFLDTNNRGNLIKRLTEVMDYPKYYLPRKAGNRYFFAYNNGLQNQPVLHMQETLNGKPIQLIDPNTFSNDGTIALSNIGVSQDGKLLAYATSKSGSDWQEVKILNIDSQEEYPETIQWVKFTGLSWHPDGTGFLYSRFPKPGTVPPEDESCFSQIYFHKIGTSQEEDILIYERPDKKELSFYSMITQDNNYIVISGHHGTDRRNRFYYRSLNEDTPFVHLLDNHDALYSLICNVGTKFYFHTDLEAPKGRVIAIDIAKPEKENWEEIIPETCDTLTNIIMVDSKLIAVYTHHAYHQMKIFDLQGKILNNLQLPGIGTIEDLYGRSKDDECFISYSSYLSPSTVLHYNLKDKKLTPWHSIKSTFQAEQFETKQIFYTSLDGTKIPMFLTHKKGLELNKKNPVLLYGYGGFNISMSPSFSPTILPWLENGGVYAVACLRGGNEYGEEWHQAGILNNKQNVFDDFISAGEWLIANDYTDKEHLAIMGGSNGGLLVSATMVQRPDLFGAVICRVPVIDMLRYHKFTVGRYWIPEYGNAEENPEHFKFMYAYSPLHNIKEGTSYPPVMIMTADTDDRVVPAHAFKFGATLQELAKGDNPILLRIEIKAGHGHGKPTKKIIEEAADIFSFIYKIFGLSF